MSAGCTTTVGLLTLRSTGAAFPAHTQRTDTSGTQARCYSAALFYHDVADPRTSYLRKHLIISPMSVTRMKENWGGGCNPPQYDSDAANAWGRAAAAVAGVTYPSTDPRTFVGVTTLSAESADSVVRLIQFNVADSQNTRGFRGRLAVVPYPGGVSPYQETSGRWSAPQPDECQRLNARLRANGSPALAAC